MGEVKLTRWQTEALRSLLRLHEKFPAHPHGFHPLTARHSAAWRRSLEPKGLISIDRISDNHFRYEITDAGRALLEAESSHGA